MAKEPISLPAPDDVWLSYAPGQYPMDRTSDRDPTAVRYVRGDAYDALQEWCSVMIVGGHVCPCSMPKTLPAQRADDGGGGGDAA